MKNRIGEAFSGVLFFGLVGLLCGEGGLLIGAGAS